MESALPQRDRQEAIDAFIKCIKPIAKNVRFMRRFKRLVIVVNGTVGAGKTTLVKILKEAAEKAGLSTLAIFERVPPQLSEFLQFEDDIRHGRTKETKNPFAFPLQMGMLNQRIEDSGRAAREREHSLVIIDRNIYGDFPFARANYERGNFTQAEWNRYMERFHEADILEPDIYVQLGISLEVSIERIMGRDRDKESTYDPTYLQLVQDIGDQIAKSLKCPVLDLSWNHKRDVDNPDERHRIGMAVFKAIDEALLRDANVDDRIQITV